MIAPRYRIFVWLAPLLTISWLTLAFLDPDPQGIGLSETIGLGYFFGSLFGHATVAAAWAAYGPGHVLWRVPLSLAWVFLLGVAILINISINGGPSEAAMVIGACLFGQWLALQVPFWGLRVGLRSRLAYFQDESAMTDAGKWQFGIRQLMIVTTVIGVVFGIGRLLFGSILRILGGGEAPIFIFLAACAIVFSLPLLVAALLRRGALVGVPIILVLICLATLWEAPLWRVVLGRTGRPNVYDLLAINLFTSGVVLAVAAVVRLNGYALASSQPGTPSQA